MGGWLSELQGLRENPFVNLQSRIELPPGCRGAVVICGRPDFSRPGLVELHSGDLWLFDFYRGSAVILSTLGGNHACRSDLQVILKMEMVMSSNHLPATIFGPN